MEGRANKKYGFSAVSVKIHVAQRFRLFSKKISSNHSETLSVMMDFFEHNSVSPQEDLGPNMNQLEKKIKSRINSLIAIIRDIEKNQTKPTAAILNALLEQPEPPKKALMIERKRWTQQSDDENNLKKF